MDLSSPTGEWSFVGQVPAAVVSQEVPQDGQSLLKVIQAIFELDCDQGRGLVPGEHPIDVPLAVGEFVSELDGWSSVHDGGEFRWTKIIACPGVVLIV